VTKSQEIAMQAPSDKAIVRRYSESIAKSPKDIKPGEAVFVNRLGVAFGRRRFARMAFAWKAGILGAFIGGAALVISGFWLPGALVYLTGFVPTLTSKYYGTGKLMAIDVLVRQGNLEEGQRRLDAAPELRRRNAVTYCFLAGNFASHRGDYATALTWWREALPRCKGLRREMLTLSIAKALLLSGQVDEARREFEAAKFAPEADQILTGQSLGRVMFVLCDPSAEPPLEEELHDWARRALEYSHTGVEVAAIGWAFERRGDDEMARFLASEALDRIHYPYLATWWPALQQWLDGHGPKADEP
jgi:tetratricopeptide (TPR) repeat protein